MEQPYWEKECVRLRAEINRLDQFLSGEVVGNKTGVKPAETITTRPTIPCPNPRCHKGWVMVQNGPDDIDHDLCPICDGNMFILITEGKDGGK
jgi:hypothetical protein